MKKLSNADLPAMPQERELWVEGIGSCPTEATGLTKREHFMVMAMQGILAGNSLKQLGDIARENGRATITKLVEEVASGITDEILSEGEE